MKILILFFLIITYSAFAEENVKNKYYLHSIVEQNKDSSTIRAIEFWVNFLYESNDSLRATYWDSDERKLLKNDYCLFDKLLMQMPRETLLQYFPPYILSAEKFRNDYQIKTVFSQRDFSISDTAVNNQNPIAIVEVFVTQKNGKYQLINSINFESLAYKTYNSGNIHYKIHPLVDVDTIACQSANKFCDSLSMLWNGYKLNDSINYYVTSGSESLGKLLGFDFAYFGMTYGYTLIEAKYIFSGTKDFNYRHELCHLIFGHINNHMLSEGLATFFGGSQNQTYPSLLIDFYKDNYPLTLEKLDTIIQYRNNKNYYTIGALLVEFVSSKSFNELKKMTEISEDENVLIKYICNISNIDKIKLIELINQMLITIRK